MTFRPTLALHLVSCFIARITAPSLSFDGFSDDAADWMDQLHDRA